MAIILQIETSTSVCSAAVAVDGKTIAIKEQAAQNIHAGSLTLFINEAMSMAGVSYDQLDAVAVSKGPGSYTGLRIGVSTAKGICFAIDKPLLAVSTLQMMSQGFIDAHPEYAGLICPMIDARRMEVFTAIFNNHLQEVLPVSAAIINEESYQDLLVNNQVSFIGDGAMKCSETIISANAHFYSDNFNSASHMSQLAFEAFNHQVFEDVAYFEPYYLKDFVITQAKKKV